MQQIFGLIICLFDRNKLFCYAYVPQEKSLNHSSLLYLLNSQGKFFSISTGLNWSTNKSKISLSMLP